MTKEFLAEHSLEECSTQFDNELEEYQKLVNSTETVDELEEMEKEVMKEQDEVNAYLKTVQYQLPDSVVFDGEKYTRKEIAVKTVYFLNKKEVEWKYTLGLYQLVKFWKSENPTTIDYGAYDSTLRLLNQVSFKGFSEWRDILACNEYFKVAHEAYSKDTSWLIFESEKHNRIMQRMQLLGETQTQKE